MSLIRIGVLVLMVLFLPVGLSFGQNTAGQIWTRGVEHAAQGNFNKAKVEFEKALKVDPSHTPAEEGLKVIEYVNEEKVRSKTAIHLFKGIAYGNKDRWDESITEINKAIDLNPNYGYIYACRGVAYFYKGQHETAIFDFNKAIEINPMYADAYSYRGLAYFMKSQYDKACSDLKRACELGSCMGLELVKRDGYCK
jgi:tetratricopeptide (TPR) repeat protein